MSHTSRPQALKNSFVALYCSPAFSPSTAGREGLVLLVLGPLGNLLVVGIDRLEVRVRLRECQEDRIHRGRRCWSQCDGGAAQECCCRDGDDRLFHIAPHGVGCLLSFCLSPPSEKEGASRDNVRD